MTTRLYTEQELAAMQNNPSERANIIGRRVPYHLQYLRDGGVNIKLEEKTDEKVLQQQQ